MKSAQSKNETSTEQTKTHERRRVRANPSNGAVSPYPEPDVSGNDDAYQPGIYRLSNRKMFRYSQTIDRRAKKQQITDRRSQPRFCEAGTLLQDRRADNRENSQEKLRKTR